MAAFDKVPDYPLGDVNIDPQESQVIRAADAAGLVDAIPMIFDRAPDNLYLLAVARRHDNDLPRPPPLALRP